MGAGAHRRVERECVRRRLVVRQPCFGAHQVAAVEVFFFSVSVLHQHNTLSLLHCGVERFGKALAVLLIDFQFVDNYLNIMGFIAVEPHSRGQVGNLAVDACVEIALAQKLVEKFLVVTLAPLNERCHKVDFLPSHLADNDIDNLVVGVLDHLLASVV